MTRHSRTVPALLIAAALTLPSVGQAQAFKVARFNIGGDGGTDYLTAEPGTGRVFVSRGTHVMVVDGTTGKVLGFTIEWGPQRASIPKSFHPDYSDMVPIIEEVTAALLAFCSAVAGGRPDPQQVDQTAAVSG